MRLDGSSGTDDGTLARSALIFLLILALVYWLWFGLTQRSITGDDGLSILAAEGVLEHGYPKLPSGFIYYRACVPSYLLAGSILLFGLNDFSIMLPSLLLALGSLFFVYLLATTLFARPMVGILAGALLVILQVQTFYATSPRMYMALQFFTVLAVYGAWRGYVKGIGKFQWITILATACAIFSHKQGGSLLVALPVSVLVVRWMQGRDRPRINHLLALGGMVVLCSIYYVAAVHRLPGSVPHIAVHGGQDPGFVGLSLNPAQWFGHAIALERAIPLGVLFAPIVVFLGCSALRARHVGVNQGIVFALLVFLIYALALTTVVRQFQLRFWILALPIYALLLGISAATLRDQFGPTNPDRPFRRVPNRAVLCGILGTWVLTVLAVSSAVFGATRYRDGVMQAYGRPSSEMRCGQDIEAVYAELRPAVAPDDIVVSSNPWVTRYYLGRVDAFLRERKTNEGEFAAFRSPTDEYFGIPLIDTPSELEELRASPRRVWIIADYKIDKYSSQRTRDFLDGSFTQYWKSEPMTVYVNSDESRGSLGEACFEPDVQDRAACAWASASRAGFSRDHAAGVGSSDRFVIKVTRHFGKQQRSTRLPHPVGRCYNPVDRERLRGKHHDRKDRQRRTKA